MGCASSSHDDVPVMSSDRQHFASAHRPVGLGQHRSTLAGSAYARRQLGFVSKLAGACSPVAVDKELTLGQRSTCPSNETELRLQIQFDRDWAFPPCGVVMTEPSVNERAARIHRAAREAVQAGRVTAAVDEIPAPPELASDVRLAHRRVRGWMDELLALASASASATSCIDAPIATSPKCRGTDALPGSSCNQYLVMHASLGDASEASMPLGSPSSSVAP